jgi:hypothetical protein
MIFGWVSVLKQWLQLRHIDSRKFWFGNGYSDQIWNIHHGRILKMNPSCIIFTCFKEKLLSCMIVTFYIWKTMNNFIKNQECASNTAGLKLKLKLNLVWLKMPSLFHVRHIYLTFLLKSAHKDTMKLLDFKGCVNLFFKITWVALYSKKNSLCQNNCMSSTFQILQIWCHLLVQITQ